MTRWLDEREQRVWRSWLLASTRLEAHLARRMQADGDISMSDFAVLVQLSEAPDGRLRAFALGRALQWEKSRLSHHLTRMERRGLVGREDCGTDRRGAFVVLAPAGREALEAAAPPHVEAVRATVFDRLTAEQVDRLGEVCDLLLSGLDPDAGCSESAEGGDGPACAPVDDRSPATR
jgi:DNA-binding MarR family transcriptional regulator